MEMSSPGLNSLKVGASQYPADHFDVARNRSCNFTLPPTRRPHVQDDLGMTSGKDDKFWQFNMRSGSRFSCWFSGHRSTALSEEDADPNAKYTHQGVTYVTCWNLLSLPIASRALPHAWPRTIIAT
jgi:hypothetical protein